MIGKPDKALAPHPATVPTDCIVIGKPDKAFTPHPATVPDA
ncbi:hypothetical protein ACKKKU_001220 [Escherichia coli]|nr:hypothetical protein [Escherichia coli]